MLTDHCFRRVENGLQEPHRPVRIPQSSCSAGVSANPTLKPQLIVKPTNQIIEIKSGTSFTFSSTSCSWLLGSGSAFCSTPLWSATTSTGEEIDKRQEKSHFEIPFSDIWTDPWCLEPVSMTPPPSWMQTHWTSARLFSIFNPNLTVEDEFLWLNIRRERAGLNLPSTFWRSSTTSTAWSTASSPSRYHCLENLIVVISKSMFCMWRQFLWLT